MNILVLRLYSAPQGNWLLSGRGKTHILAPGHGTRVPYRASFAFPRPLPRPMHHACMLLYAAPRRQTAKAQPASGPVASRPRSVGVAWWPIHQCNARPSWDPARNARLSSSRSRPLHILSFRRLFIHQSPPQKGAEERKSKRLPLPLVALFPFALLHCIWFLIRHSECKSEAALSAWVDQSKNAAAR